MTPIEERSCHISLASLRKYLNYLTILHKRIFNLIFIDGSEYRALIFEVV